VPRGGPWGAWCDVVDVVDVVGEERQLRLKIPRYESKVEKKDESSWRIYEVGVIMHRVPLPSFGCDRE